MRERKQLPELRFVTPAIGVIFALAILIAVPFYITSQSGFCNLCHREQTYYNTWSRSTHARVGCSQCHGGYFNLVASKDMKNQTCQACHNLNRRVTAAGDLKVPPRHHLMQRAGLKCLDCHQGLVHNKHPAGRNHLREKLCIECHKKEQISNDCPTCHYEKKSRK